MNTCSDTKESKYVLEGTWRRRNYWFLAKKLRVQASTVTTSFEWAALISPTIITWIVATHTNTAAPSVHMSLIGGSLWKSHFLSPRSNCGEEVQIIDNQNFVLSRNSLYCPFLNLIYFREHASTLWRNYFSIRRRDTFWYRFTIPSKIHMPHHTYRKWLRD